jgi:hypothetical protein
MNDERRIGDKSRQALSEIERAEAELAVLKQEGVLRNLLSTGAPTAEAAAQLARLREAVETLAAAPQTPRS